MVGRLPRSGIGLNVDAAGDVQPEALRACAVQRNDALLRSLKEADESCELMDMTYEDARRGRMSWPRVVDQLVSEPGLLHPRFAVKQTRPDGTVKLRAVDHFSWSENRQGLSVNSETSASEKMRHDTLDKLGEVMKRLVKSTGQIPGLFKADVDAAFRRIPICPAHRWAACVAFIVAGQVWFLSLAHVCCRALSAARYAARRTQHARLEQSAPYMRGNV